MKKWILIFFFSSFVCYAAEPSRQLGHDEIRAFSLSGNYQLNNNNDIGNYIPIPVFYYQKKSIFNSPSAIQIISAGIFNQFSWSLLKENGLGMESSFRSLIYFAGDNVNIDGNDYNGSYDFRGNFYDLMYGINYKKTIYKLPFRVSLKMVGRYQHFFNRGNASNYSFMNNFWRLSPALKIEYGFWGPMLKIPYMLQTVFFMQKNFRFGDELFGNNNSLSFKNPLQLEWNIKSKVKIFERISLWSSLFLAGVVDGDRITAVSRGTHFPWEQFDQLFLRNVRSDYSILKRLQLEYDLLKEKRLSIRIGGMLSYYRELLINGKRKQFVYAGQFGFSGIIRKNIIWHFDYGAANGINNNKWLHEVAFRALWKF